MFYATEMDLLVLEITGLQGGSETLETDADGGKNLYSTKQKRDVSRKQLRSFGLIVAQAFWSSDCGR